MNIKRPLFIFFILLIFSNSYSQEIKNENPIEIKNRDVEHDNNHFKKHSIGVVIGHTHINTGVKDNSGNSLIALPSFAINYNYNFNERWAIGLHNDIIIEEFVVSGDAKNEHGSESFTFSENSEGKTIDRGKPVSSAVMVSYKPIKHLALLVGGGMDFSEHKDFAVIRLGVEAPFHIPNNWEIFGNVSFDININAYNSLSFGLGIAKLF